METLDKYDQAVMSVLAKYGDRLDDQTFLITDTTHHQYQLATAGWQNGKYINYATLHFHIRPDGKIWIYENRTEDDVAAALVKQGVAQSDIVLGFLPEYARPYSNYAAY
jgi:hypothetical protein